MIKIYKYCVVLLSVLSMNFAIAASDNIRIAQVQSTLPTIPNKIFRHKYSIGIEIFPYVYTEPNVMRSKGLFYGVNGSYAFYLGKDYYIQLDGRAVRGKTNYSSKRTGSYGTKEPNWLFETRLLLNRHFQLYNNLDVNPFFGLGYRYKEDDSSFIKSSTGHTGYLRKSNYYYIPIGMSMNYNLKKGWNIHISSEYDLLLEGKQSSHHDQKTMKFNQSRGYGLRSEILLERTFDKYVLSIGPYINYWNIGDSDRDFLICKCCGNHSFYFYEPKNNTSETGLKIKYSF